MNRVFLIDTPVTVADRFSNLHIIFLKSKWLSWIIIINMKYKDSFSHVIILVKIIEQTFLDRS